MKQLFCAVLLLSFGTLYSQTADSSLFLRTSWHEGQTSQQFFYLNHAGDTVLRLDPLKYYQSFTDTFNHFAVVGMKDKSGWWAINRSEQVLFEVFNASIGEPEADQLANGFIQIT